MQWLKSAILAIFLRPLIISQELKNLFVLGSYESLERLKGKIGEVPFF